MSRFTAYALVAFALLAPRWLFAADFMEQDARIKGRSYSPAVITEGGHAVWLAGESTITDLQGKNISGDFEAQIRTIFALMDQTLHRAGGNLKDVVTMTVFMTDIRNATIVSRVRKELFSEGHLPASAQIMISGLAVPGSVVEVQAVAVVGDKCKTGSCVAH